MYDRQNRKVIHFTSNTNAKAATATVIEPDDPALADLIGASKRDQLVDEIDLLDGASCDFDLDRVRHGKLSPVFFGSALTNFGVEPFLEEFLRMTTAPLPRKAGDEIIDSFDEDFSAFVFKIQANMNKATGTASPLCASSPASSRRTRRSTTSRAARKSASPGPSS